MVPKDVAYLGIPGSFSHNAAQFYFMKKATLQPQPSIESVLLQVQQEKAGFGVVPIENSSNGSIMETYDQLLKTHLAIVGEVVLRIHHHLAGYSKGVSGVKHCYSHPAAFNQCNGFFQKNKTIEKMYTSDTATAAKLVSEKKNPDEAAITGKQAAQLYHLPIIAENIEDISTNYTRFAVVGKKANKNGNKFSCVLSVKHEPGSLVRVLKPLSDFGLNMTKIESRPLFGKLWEYIFFLDFETQTDIRNVEKALVLMKEDVAFLTQLGQYSKGNIYES